MAGLGVKIPLIYLVYLVLSTLLSASAKYCLSVSHA